jgi:alpha-amylase/alpha-mannosidase (GH57 family)
LRESLDWLRDKATEIFEREGGKVLHNPWAARNEYVEVVLNRTDDNVRKFLQTHALPDASANRILRILEIQRHAMLMYTSCGWFFDEISGIETTQVMQYACRVIQLANQIGDVDLEPEFMQRLESAPSNVSQYENGSGVYKKVVLPSRTNLQRVGIHYAVSSIFEDEPESLTVFNYNTANESFIKKEAGEQKLVWALRK